MTDKPPTMQTRPVDITIIDTATNEHVTYEEEFYSDPPDDDGTFIWDEGNYGCDCNRALFLARAKGLDEPSIEDTPCNTGDNRYLVSIREKDGRLIYRDDAFPAAKNSDYRLPEKS